jgi:predicted DNA-binding transcriptional regulator AlpA
MNGNTNAVQAELSTAQSLLTLKDVQANSKMSRSFLYAEIAAGRIKPIKIGRAIRFVSSEIDQWILDRIAAR